MSFFRGVFFCIIFSGARSIGPLAFFFVALILVYREYARRMSYGILRHGFVRYESDAFDNSIRPFDVYGTVGVNTLFLLIPIYFFGKESFVLHVFYADVSSQSPELQFIEEYGGIA